MNVVDNKSFEGETSDDSHGHGTHCAGIVASTNQTYRGVAYGANLINAKFMDGGTGTVSDAMKAIDWAIFNASGGGDVLSCSFGSNTTSDDSPFALFMDAVVDDLLVSVAVAAGNEGSSSQTITDPGVAYNIITVGAMNDSNTNDTNDDSLATFSSRGPTVGGRIKPDIVAPGVSILSCNYNWENEPNFTSKSGTSMATPHIAGALALLLDYGLSDPREMKALLINTAGDWGGSRSR